MSQVKLILKESVHSLGEAGDLVSVKPGFARNFLLPQGKAILATESRVRELEHHKRIVAEKAAKELSNLQETKKKLEGLRIEIGARAGEEGKLFGSVTTVQIAQQLAEQGYEVDRRRIDLKDAIKELGEHAVPVKLHREIVAELTVVVTSEGGPPPEPEDRTVDPDDAPQERDRGDEDDED
ncbi:MAG: 50S ribosomal protein L9 [Myxococcota bacterium]